MEDYFDIETLYSVEAERAALGALLLDQDAVKAVAETIAPTDFYRDSHRLIYESIISLERAGNPIDLVTVTEALRERNTLEKAGGMVYIAELLSVVPSSAGANDYAKIIKDKAMTRALKRYADTLGAYCKEAGADPYELIAKAEKELVDLNRARTIERAAAGERVTAFLEAIDGANTPAIKTGFPALDAALDGGLYEGLYIFGAITSIGKTTYVLQLADQIARHGKDVLFFSLEMSEFELMAKSLSRLTMELCEGNMANAKTTRGILDRARWDRYSEAEEALIIKSAAEYRDYGRRIRIIEGVGNIGATEIKREVNRHIYATGNTPVVIIDYLQILDPYDMKASDKQNTDKAVLELKRMSRDKKLTVIAISSFNRDNYTAPVNLAAFKESGAIEYSSDVLIGLQLTGMDDIKGGESKKTENIKKIESLKNADPRGAQLKILKNRNGKTGANLFYDYYPKFNTFREADPPDGELAWVD